MSAILDDGFDDTFCIYFAEQLFAITMTDEEVEKLRTAGELHEYILHRLRLAKTPATDTGPCPTASAFYRLRSRFKLSAPDAAEFRPDTPVTVRLAPGEPRAQWAALSRQLCLELPSLTFSNRTQSILFRVLFAFVLFACAAVAYWGGIRLAFISFISISVLSVTFLAFLDLWARPHFAQTVPREAQTIGDLAYLEAFTQIEANPPKSWSRHQAWVAVQSILAYSAGVSPRQIKKGTTFSDLNAQSL